MGAFELLISGRPETVTAYVETFMSIHLHFLKPKKKCPEQIFCSGHKLLRGVTFNS